MPITERTFMARAAVVPSGCWEWTGSRSADGYGRVSVGNHRTGLAHRVGYELLTGPIPDGLQIDHLCRNRACVNPAHLEPVTQLENIRRGIRHPKKEPGFCWRGHRMDEHNTYTWGGFASCKSCRRIAGRKHDAKRRAKTPCPQ